MGNKSFTFEPAQGGIFTHATHGSRDSMSHDHDFLLSPGPFKVISLVENLNIIAR